MPAILVLDQGTSATRAALFREGRLVAQARREVSIAFPLPGHAEQDAAEVFDSATDVLERVAASLRPGEEAVLGVTNQRSTLVLWDSDTGRPLGPALSWRDARAVTEAQALLARVPDLPARTGLPASPAYGAPKAAWALAHWPSVRAAADAGRLRLGPISTWLQWKLSRGECHAVDPTNAQRMLLLDLRALDWDDDLVAASGLSRDWLPELRPTDGAFGDARIGGRAIPVRCALGDQQAALLGHAAGEDDVARVHLGTGGFVMRETGDAARLVPGLLTGLARADTNRPRRYLVEGPVNAAGSALDRLRDAGVLRDGEDVDQLAARATAPATLVPAWAGLAAPWWSPRARAVLMDWDESATRADLVLGAVRGIAVLIADIVDAMAGSGLAVARLDLTGSVSRLSSVAGAIADATRRSVRVADNAEASIEGVAVALAETVGEAPPSLSLEPPRILEPREDLAAARRRFDVARRAAMELARDEADA